MMGSEVKMYGRILVPLDGSDLAERSLPYVKHIAKKLNSAVILMMVCLPSNYAELPLKAYIQKKTKEFQVEGIKTNSKILRGEAATAILKFAQKNDIDLIVMSAHGGSGISRWSLGSCATKVLQKTNIPTLLVRSNKTKAKSLNAEISKILIALDGSHFSEAIIPYVKRLIEINKPEVILVRVIEPVTLPFTTGYIEHEKYEKEIMEKAKEEASSYLQKMKGLFEQEGTKASTVLLKGHPANAILNYAEESNIRLIAITTHGYTGITKWAYGSVAANIIESSTIPILLFRPQLPSVDE